MTSYERCKSALQKIVSSKGKTIVQDTETFFKVLNEEIPDLVKERKRLQLAFLEGIVDDLVDYQLYNSSMEPMVFDRMSDRLSDLYGMAIEDARDIVNLIWYMLSGTDELQKAREEKDLGVNFLLAIELAQQGDEEAICAFADRKYLFHDEQLAKHLIQINKLALQGNPFAQVVLSEEYERGKFLPNNKDLSYLWAKMAAESGNVAGKMRLAVCLYKGVVTDQDVSSAMKHFLATVCKGYWEDIIKTFDKEFAFQAELKCSILNGYESEQVTRIRKRMAKEAKSAFVRAYSCMALGDMFGQYLSSKTKPEAADWYAQSAECEMPDALWKWAMYRNYRSVISEKKGCDLTVISLMEKAAENNAQYAIRMVLVYLGIDLDIIDGTFFEVPKHYQSQKKVEYWISRFVECTEEIVDVDVFQRVFQNISEGYRSSCIQSISKECRSSSIERLIDRKKISFYVAGQLYLLVAVQEDSDFISRGIALLEQAAKDNDYQACQKLADIYQNGILVPKNMEKAAFYWEKEYYLVYDKWDETGNVRLKQPLAMKLGIYYSEDLNMKTLADYWFAIP